ncbi:hypothetical protein BDR04DRAFT_1129505 [Suillus decipiens]|nr:hypothetical protein BDR04DRAFT_1129505 [Suillus decipiens]
MLVPHDGPAARELDCTKIFIPNTNSRWPWPCHLNLYYPEVTVECAAWFASCKAFSAEKQDAFEHIHCNLVSSLAYPNASRAHVCTTCELMRILFLIDEYSDVSKPSSVCEQKNAVMDALHDPHKPQPKGEWVGGEVAHQFWECAICDAGVQLQKQFITTFNTYLEEDHIHDIQSYIDIHRSTVTMRPLFALMELGLDITDEVISHPTIETMATCMDMIFIDNITHGDASHNMITIIMHKHDTDINAIPKWGEPLDSQVRVYCDGLGNWSERYFGTKGSEIGSKRWMLLIPKDCLKKSKEIGPVHVDSSLL